MARFYISVPTRGRDYTRTGHAADGVEAHARGWSVGARVHAHAEGRDAPDLVDVYRTTGSHARRADRLALRFVEGDEAPTLYPGLFEWRREGPPDDPDGFLKSRFYFGETLFHAEATAVDAVDAEGRRDDVDALGGGMRRASLINGRAYIVVFFPEAA